MQIFIARQPIFDRKRAVFGYELLFRDSLENCFGHPDPEQASSQVITHCSTVFDLATLTDGRCAFVNATRRVLLGEWLSLLPPESTVVEVLETIEPDDEVVAACRRLKRAGYRLALDDFVYDERYEPLLRLADILKIDVLQTSPAQQAALFARTARLDIRLLAEKVEDQNELSRAVDLGYDYFQGYFFARPEVLSRRDVPARKWTQLELLRQIHRSDLDMPELANLLRRDVAMSYKLLRHINSAFFGWRVQVHSVHHALVLLGESEFRKWASLVALVALAEDKPPALLVQAVFRARFLECWAPLLGMTDRSQDLFLMGLFSMLDAFVERPLDEALAELPIADDVKQALTDASGAMGAALAACKAYERGRWEELSDQARRISLDESQLPELFLQATEWTRRGLGDSAPPTQPVANAHRPI